MQEFYISGIYFKEYTDIHKFVEYARWLKRAAAENFDGRDIDYALLEIIAEYKRHGASMVDVLGAMLMFDPVFLAKEIIRRKQTAKKDIEKCMKAALDLGLKQTAGTKEFPIFKKDNGC